MIRSDVPTDEIIRVKALPFLPPEMPHGGASFLEQSPEYGTMLLWNIFSKI